MEYMALMNDPDLQPLWKRGFSNEAGRLFQGIRDIPCTNICLFVELTSIQKYREIEITNLTKRKRSMAESQWAATD
jgi:hypothetical protein